MAATVTDGIAGIWLCWSFFVLSVQSIGVVRIFLQYSKPPPRAAVESLPDDAVPHVTVIRPVKGLEPALYECLASTFQQTYPRSRLSVHLCVESRADPAYGVLERVVADYPQVDARVFLEAEDPVLHGAGGHVDNLGPNPKIRNISRAYREARGDVVWIVDCNVWVAPGTAGRMVDKLFGFRAAGRARAAPYKFVHQLPLVVDVGDAPADRALLPTGARLDEMFMATTHAKFYSAINTVGVAPCIVGKSNMFRRSHLDHATAAAAQSSGIRARGLDYFSAFICEDHLIGDLLWRTPIPGYRRHGLAPGDLALQPMAAVSVRAYVARRVRWLRVRKWTVLLATLVEPGVESFLCCFYASFAVTTLVPRAAAGSSSSLITRFGSAAATALAIEPSWRCMLRGWLVGIAIWATIDWLASHRLHACRCVAVDDAPAAATPVFARGRGGKDIQRRGGRPRRALLAWLAAWLGREAIALPIWTWAVLLGTTVSWRGRQFRVGMDMRVVEMDEEKRQD